MGFRVSDCSVQGFRVHDVRQLGFDQNETAKPAIRTSSAEREAVNPNLSATNSVFKIATPNP